MAHIFSLELLTGLEPLGYHFSTFLLVHNLITKDVLYLLSHSSVAEAKGFEPLWACTQTVFKTASL